MSDPVSVSYTAEFKRNLRQLTRKYPSLSSDLRPLLDQLALGETPGDQIKGVAYEVFKVRLANSDLKRGKSGGYRIIYQRVEDGSIVLITLYSKTEQSDVAPDFLRQIIAEWEAQNTSSTDTPSLSES